MIKFCDFACLLAGCQCSVCGYELKRDYPIAPRRVCNRKGYLAGRRAERLAEPPPKPSLARKAWNYAVAVEEWVAAGRPRRSDAEIKRIAAICRACEHYVDGRRPHCGVCGCTCSEGQNPLTNKITMATQSCPLEPPKWV